MGAVPLDYGRPVAFLLEAIEQRGLQLISVTCF